MASFQAKIGWKRMTKRENKKILLWLHFKPKQVIKCRDREKIKIPSWHYGILSCQKRLEKAEKE